MGLYDCTKHNMENIYGSHSYLIGREALSRFYISHQRVSIVTLRKVKKYMYIFFYFSFFSESYYRHSLVQNIDKYIYIHADEKKIVDANITYFGSTLFAG